ncbi:calcium-binding protein [Pararhizobium sp. O133]|uniref:calcium-binding protein n=1 Tax=Pararhizobium sp. O133 TaxID=3449278 RepID=UPI003F685A51
MAKIVGTTSAEEKLIGTAEDDIIIGGPGTNILYGKGGADTFVIKANLITTKSSTYDTIKDFQVGVDKIDLSVLGVSSWDQFQSLVYRGPTSVGIGLEYNKVRHILNLSNITFDQLSADDFIFDTSGPRVLSGTKYIDTILGSAGDDTLTGGVSDTVYGGDGNDTLRGSGTLYGGAGDDMLNGYDVSHGGKGNDTLICRGSVYGDSGRDVFKLVGYGFSSSTIEDFKIGVDKIDLSEFGIYSFDQLKLVLKPSFSGGFASIVTYYGSDAPNYARPSEHRIRDLKVGDLSASDFIFTSSDVKPRNGTALNDFLLGSNGADVLKAGAGSDEVFAGDGDDIIIDGQGGWNTLYGMGGADTFKLAARFSAELEGTWDVIADFEVGKDKIDVSALGISDFGQMQAILEMRNAKDTVFDAYTSEEFNFGATLKNVSMHDLKASDFIFSMSGAKNQTGNHYSGRMFGSREGETLNGGAGDDEIYGGGGNDYLIGGDGIDKLFGGAGNDILDGRGGDILYGGTGNDTFFLSDRYSVSMVIADFEVGVEKIDLTTIGISSLDQVQAIMVSKSPTDIGFTVEVDGRFVSVTWMNLALSSFTSRDFIFSKRGALNLTGTSRDDWYFGSVKADTLKGGDGNDHLLGGNGNDILDGGGLDDTVYGGLGNDTIDGGEGRDILHGEAGNDVIRGGDGDDTIYTGLGKDSVDGGLGLDKVRFVLKTSLDLTTPTNSTGEAQFTTYLNIEEFHGSAASDRMVGTRGIDIFYGEAGNDTLKGMGGNDVLRGGDGNDRLDGGDGNDKVLGGNGNDVLGGGAGKDRIDGGLGDDLIIASSYDDVYGGIWGSDTVDFSRQVTLSLDDRRLNTGEAEGSNYYEVEIFDGSDADDIMVSNDSSHTFIGGGGNDRLAGMNGFDVLSGVDGNDLLYGGRDADKLTGGKGADVFLYNYITDSNNSDEARDTIFDFSGEEGDRIDLFNIDASTKVAGDQAFIYLGKGAFTGKAGELRYDKLASDTYIYADTNGDKKADFSIHLDDAVALSKGYFML